MGAFALIHGGGGSAWDWHLVASELRQRGHDPVAVDLPMEDNSAGWWDYADAVVEAVGDHPNLIVVGHSLGGFSFLWNRKHQYAVLIVDALDLDRIPRPLDRVLAHALWTPFKIGQP